MTRARPPRQKPRAHQQPHRGSSAAAAGAITPERAGSTLELGGSANSPMSSRSQSGRAQAAFASLKHDHEDIPITLTSQASAAGQRRLGGLNWDVKADTLEKPDFEGRPTPPRVYGERNWCQRLTPHPQRNRRSPMSAIRLNVHPALRERSWWTGRSEAHPTGRASTCPKASGCCGPAAQVRSRESSGSYI